MSKKISAYSNPSLLLLQKAQEHQRYIKALEIKHFNHSFFLDSPSIPHKSHMCVGDVCCSSSFQPPAKCYTRGFGCFSLLPLHSSALPHPLHHSCSHTHRWSSCSTLQGCCRSRIEPSQQKICCLSSPELGE